MKPIDVLIRNYKLETKRMSAQSNANRVGIFIGLSLGILLMTFLLDHTLMWTIGKSAPLPVLFLAIAVFSQLHRRGTAILVWGLFLVCLIASYMTPTPFFHLLVR